MFVLSVNEIRKIVVMETCNDVEEKKVLTGIVEKIEINERRIG